jgi:hypothetical protein
MFEYFILTSTRNGIVGLVAVALLLGLGSPSWAQQEPATRFFPAPGSPTSPKVSISWNRYYDANELAEYTKAIATAYPNLVERVSIGTSFQGRDIWMLAITNEATGPADRKPAVYVDGNIHSNELQAAEVSLYMAWYLTESYAHSPAIRRLLDSVAFYIVPTINPDGREDFMRRANTMHSPRSGVQPFDDDRDGLVDEDGFDDLNNDGHITQMIRRSHTGRFRKDPANPRRLVRVPDDQQGEYEYLGDEGIDNDGDGSVNEDRTGYRDPNRDWGWLWQPSSIERAAGRYPFSVPENRAVADFIRQHPNIGAALTYHNTGGMMLIGPGTPDDVETYNNTDKRLYDHFGKLSETLLPGYRYINTYEDLYPVYGGESDWMYGSLGILAYTGELWTPYYMFHRESPGYFGDENDLERFDRQVLFEQCFVGWDSVNHPQYGWIEVGGFKKSFTRNTPGFQLEEESHRNLAVAVALGQQLPQLSFANLKVEPVGEGLYSITVDVVNSHLLPTHLAHDQNNRITRPNVATLEGPEVVAGMVVTNRDLNQATLERRGNGQRITAPPVPGHGRVCLRWVVRGAGEAKIKFDSARGGVIGLNVPLQ